MKNSNSYKVIYLLYCLILFCAFDLAGHELPTKSKLSKAKLQVSDGIFEVASTTNFDYREGDGLLYGKAGTDEVSLMPLRNVEFLIKEDGIRGIFSAADNGGVDEVTVHMCDEHKAIRVKK